MGWRGAVFDDRQVGDPEGVSREGVWEGGGGGGVGVGGGA